MDEFEFSSLLGLGFIAVLALIASVSQPIERICVIAFCCIMYSQIVRNHYRRN